MEGGGCKAQHPRSKSFISLASAFPSFPDYDPHQNPHITWLAPSKPRISLGLGSQGRISLGLGSPNPTYPLAWDSQTPHIPWLGIPKPRISLGLGFPKPEYPLAWDSQNPHIPWLRFSLFSRFSFFAQIGIAAPLVEPAPQRRLPHTQLRSHFNPSSLTSRRKFLRGDH